MERTISARRTILVLAPLAVALALALSQSTLWWPEAAPADAREAARLRLFPSSYAEARDQFRSLCAQARGTCEQQAIAGGADLAIDYGIWRAPGGGERLLVLQSGIHGSEALAGSAVQALFIQDHLESYLQAGYDVLLVHALNPWGAAHARRTDANNVNLNRNFLAPGERPIENRYYASLLQLAQPAGAIGVPEFARLGTELRMISTVIAAGTDAPIRIGINQGQYQYPEGINYGGNAPAVQVGVLRRLLEPFLAAGYQRILFFDLHTGLGPASTLSLIQGREPNEELRSWLARALDQVQARRIVWSDPKDPKGFPTSGDVVDWFPAIMPDPSRVLALTLEYGTIGDRPVDQMRSQARMLLENRMTIQGCSRRACEQIESDFRELFYPSETSWRVLVLRAAADLFAAARTR